MTAYMQGPVLARGDPAETWRMSRKEGKGVCVVRVLRWARRRQVPLWLKRRKAGEACRSVAVILGSPGSSWGLLRAVT